MASADGMPSAGLEYVPTDTCNLFITGSYFGKVSRLRYLAAKIDYSTYLADWTENFQVHLSEPWHVAGDQAKEHKHVVQHGKNHDYTNDGLDACVHWNDAVKNKQDCADDDEGKKQGDHVRVLMCFGGLGTERQASCGSSV